MGAFLTRNWCNIFKKYFPGECWKISHMIIKIKNFVESEGRMETKNFQLNFLKQLHCINNWWDHISLRQHKTALNSQNDNFIFTFIHLKGVLTVTTPYFATLIFKSRGIKLKNPVPSSNKSIQESELRSPIWNNGIVTAAYQQSLGFMSPPPPLASRNHFCATAKIDKNGIKDHEISFDVKLRLCERGFMKWGESKSPHDVIGGSGRSGSRASEVEKRHLRVRQAEEYAGTIFQFIFKMPYLTWIPIEFVRGWLFYFNYNNLW